MADIDVFNGDADGLIALLQLRWAEPRRSELVTGVKRDIQLLRKVQAGYNDRVTVLDISFEKNVDDVQRLLNSGASVFYVDHHRAGSIPSHPSLVTRIDPAVTVCTSLLVDQYLNGRYRAWAIAAAFGDNLNERAQQLAKSSGLNEVQTEALHRLGILLNYNGYGRTVDDLHYHPGELYRALQPYSDPFEVINQEDSVFSRLNDGYTQDMAQALQSVPYRESSGAVMYLLADTSWSRRISGVYGNVLANDCPERAHVVCTANGDGSYTVSVRAPVSNRQGADDVCRQFKTGGGRAAAAGINALPEADLDQFWKVLSHHYMKDPTI
ncbi:MAG: hypothetical protein CENE_00296 [Candidatus Celerinatantimonas neptuna]|nr:MAG: hypothetical protein CENE_00296 [Candidatus Celerinatantimonas neptuna]